MTLGQSVMLGICSAAMFASIFEAGIGWLYSLVGGRR